MRVPPLDNARLTRSLAGLVRSVLAGEPRAEARLEAAVARAFNFDRIECRLMLSYFKRLPENFRDDVLNEFPGDEISKPPYGGAAPMSKGNQLRFAQLRAKIPNHYSAKLSNLDLDIARAVPPGGNWKNIPREIPSQRLEQIRQSFAAGEGSACASGPRRRPRRGARRSLQACP